ncbi:MAG: complex I NDUFA9 subunit family protein [Caulobacterales bacterium]|nr:complex I NDUFA9 subunit family protein [Caulobacterales bacterium]
MSRSDSLVTVFGGSGFLGSQVVRALLRNGHRVRIAVRNPNLAFESQTQGRVGQIQRVACDVRDETQVAAALDNATAAVNLVGILHESPWQSFSDLHAKAPATIAQLCARRGIKRLVHVSAIGADASAGARYARTKGEGEVAALSEFKATTVIRPSVVFGRDDDLLNRFGRLATLSPVLPMPGGGDTRFQPVYVGDVAEAVTRALTDPSTAGRAYELGGPEILTLRQILELVNSETRRARSLIPLPWPVAGAVGLMAEPLSWVGLTPPLTRDQVTMMKTDNVVATGAAGLSDLGIEATGIEAIAPTYLWRYRDGGQFADMAPA